MEKDAIQHDTSRVATGALLDEAVLRVVTAQRSWERRTPADRARRLKNVRRRIVEAQRVLIDTISRETEKPVTEIATQEVTATLGMLRFCERQYPRWLHGHRFRYLRPGFWTKSNTVHYDPIGVVAVIGPANFPFSLVVMQAYTALLCGNGVVLKPSERCPQTARCIHQIFQTSDLPNHLVEVVTGAAETVQQLIAHPAIGKVIFTGSSETGRYIAECCGRYFKPCILELGGEGAAIVCEDADLRLAARGVLWSALYANGRSCIGTRRVLVLPGIRQAFGEALAEEYRALRIGPPHDAATEVSRGHTIRLEVHPSHVDAGPGDYARSSGSARDAFREPVLCVQEVATLDDAVQIVNASPFGLSTSVWSKDAGTAQAIARRLRVGMVWINDASAALPCFPWGGVRQSGWGRLFSQEALPELTHLKVISHDRRCTARPKFWWFPYSDQQFDLTVALNAFLYGPKRWRTLGTLWTTLWRYLIRGRARPS